MNTGDRSPTFIDAPAVGARDLSPGYPESCDESHCVTCSDEAVPMRVTDAGDGSTARCGEVEVMTELVGPVEVGDVLLVHAGVALVRAAG